MPKLPHGTTTPKLTHSKNATRAESLLNSLLGRLSHWSRDFYRTTIRLKDISDFFSIDITQVLFIKINNLNTINTVHVIQVSGMVIRI